MRAVVFTDIRSVSVPNLPDAWVITKVITVGTP
jgi:hypothetical protein